MIRPISVTSNRYEWAKDQLEALLADSPGLNVYDIGCGEAEMRPVVEELGGNWFGFDRYPSGGEVESLNLDNPISESHHGKADVILFMDVIEHLFNPGSAIGNLAKVARPGCKLLMSTPNPSHSRDRTHLLFKGQLSSFTTSAMETNHHVFPLYPHVAGKLLGDYGFSVSDFHTLEGRTALFSGKFGIRWPFTFLHSALLATIESCSPVAKGGAYAMVAVRDEVDPESAPGQSKG